MPPKINYFFAAAPLRLGRRANYIFTIPEICFYFCDEIGSDSQDKNAPSLPGGAARFSHDAFHLGKEPQQRLRVSLLVVVVRFHRINVCVPRYFFGHLRV